MYGGDIRNELTHHGILGMKWGVRRYQNEDGSLTERGRARLDKKDLKWVKKKGEKITAKAESASRGEATRYAQEVTGERSHTSRGQISKTFMNQYNQKLAQLMNQRIGNVRLPSGRVIRYVAKRGEIGVHTAMADQDYNMNQVRNGVNSSGKVAYKKEIIDRR